MSADGGERGAPATDVHGSPGMVVFVRGMWGVRHPRLAQGMESKLVANRCLYRTIILGGASRLSMRVLAQQRVAWGATLLFRGLSEMRVTPASRATSGPSGKT